MRAVRFLAAPILAAPILASLDPGEWEIRVAGAIARSAPDLDGQPVTVRDTVLRAARRP